MNSPASALELFVCKHVSALPVAEAGRFLRGEIAVVVERNEGGAPGSSMWCRKEQLAEAIVQSQNVFGASKKYDAWAWPEAIEC